MRLTNKANSIHFLEWVTSWYENLDGLCLDDAINNPQNVALISIDLVKGFTSQGPLASDRVAGIIQPIVNLFTAAHDRAVGHFVLTQDAHPADAVEFRNYGPHCVEGTSQAETVDELLALSFSDSFVVIAKNSINPFIETQLGQWLDDHADLDTFIVVGDCTDICTYQLAVQLQLRANARQEHHVRVIVPVDCVQTYDLPVRTAADFGLVPHDADVLHEIFLYHMMLNGVEIVANLF